LFRFLELESKFVIEVAKHLEKNLSGIFYYEDYQRSDESFIATITNALKSCNVMLIFVGEQGLSEYQKSEFESAFRLHEKQKRHFFTVLLPGVEDPPPELLLIQGYPIYRVKEDTVDEAYELSKSIVHEKLNLPWNSDDDLPINPHLFDYEKDIIDYFISKEIIENRIDEIEQRLPSLDKRSKEYLEIQDEYQTLHKDYESILEKQIMGCPADWPEVVRWKANARENLLDEQTVGKFRADDAKVVAAALSNYLDGFDLIQKKFYFPEAGPRKRLNYPRPEKNLNVGIVVSGGIAPGINAVIDGITQRHHMYADKQGYKVRIYGFKDGFQAFDDIEQSKCFLIPKADSSQPTTFVETSSHVNEGGSILGTSRYFELLQPSTRKRTLENIVEILFAHRIEILYIIGGDGSMKAAHSIWSFAQEFSAQRRSDRKLSVIAVPKTMDNDILWVWQTFGFLSAVERARELIENLATEVRSNPRLGVVQLFGSDSGFVVSHAVLASRTGICDAALIPESNFSMKELAISMKKRICERFMQEAGGRIPYGFIVLAETAIPTDAIKYIDDSDIGLSGPEKEAVIQFNKMRENTERIEGQTDDALRTAGLKIVSRGLLKELPKISIDHDVQPNWDKLRVFTNEPRHLLRSTPPRSSDIITAQRLGILAVDNAMAGYTDFMISQWLTEYVLVPLKLVILGRKRIPREGIFWKSVRAKTGQPLDMV